MLQFPYQPVPLTGPAPPSLPSAATAHWRPFAPVAIIGPTGVARYFKRALVDPGADDTVFPLDIVSGLQVVLRPDTGHRLRWRGQHYPLHFGEVELQLAEGGTVCRWTAVVCFSNAPIPYRILGNAGCLEFFNVTFRGADRLVEFEPNQSYAGTIRWSRLQLLGRLGAALQSVCEKREKRGAPNRDRPARVLPRGIPNGRPRIDIADAPSRSRHSAPLPRPSGR